MIPPWLVLVAIVALAVGFASAVVIAADLIRRPQQMWIMNLVWPITALYFGPLAVYWYWKLGRSTMHAMHGMHHPSRPFWQTVIVETTHCGAGCTLGDVIAEFAVFATGIVIAGSGLLTNYVCDFALAYVFGIFFQFFAIAPMRGLSFWPGLWAAIQADTLSLIAFEIGLFAWMAVMMTFPFHMSLTPLTATYWFLMQIGMMIGFITSYPANWLLVRIGVKEPM